MAINTYIKRKERGQINTLNFIPQGTKERWITKPKISKRNKIAKIRAEINEKQNLQAFR